MLDDSLRNMTIVNNIEYLFVDLSILTDTLSLVYWGYVVAGSAAAQKAAHCVDALLCTPIRLLCTFVHVCNMHSNMSISQVKHIARRNLRKLVGATVNEYFSDSQHLIIWRPPLNYLAAAI